MPYRRWDPFQDLIALHQAMFGEGPGMGLSPKDGTVWVPPVDIYETSKAYVIKAELPGIDPDKIKLEYRDNKLHLIGEKGNSRKGDVKHHQVERIYGPFKRTFLLPEFVSCNEIEASYEKGVLQVVVPKSPHEANQCITVKTGI